MRQINGNMVAEDLEARSIKASGRDSQCYITAIWRARRNDLEVHTASVTYRMHVL